MDLKLVIADDHSLVRTAIRAVFEAEGHEVVEAEDGTRVVSLIHQTSPDVVLLDLLMPKLNGLDTLKRIRSKYVRLPVIMLSGSDDNALVTEAIELGATSFLSKAIVANDLVATVGAVLSGAVLVPHRVPIIAGLTPRQEEVLACLGEGLSNPEIGLRLGITENSAKWHVTNLMKRLGATSRLQLGLLAPQHRGGVISLDERRRKGAA